MRSAFRFIVVTVSILLAAAHCYAAALDEMKKDDEGVFVGGYKQEVPLGEARRPGEKSSPLSLDKGKLGMEIKTTPPEAPQKKAKIILKAEPGDGLVSLSWKVTGFLGKTGDHPLKFTVFFGTESGRYEKKLEVGDASEYKIRDLKNNQVYYVKVQGHTRVQEETDDVDPQWAELTIFSNEAKVTPLAVEEQGSPLEKTFAGRTYTLHDKVETSLFKREIRQFGYDFFKNSLVSSTLTDNMPVGPDYIIGPGDSLRIDLWGTLQGRYDLTVDRNGEITIPKVGNVKVWGISYGEAKEVINKATSRYFKGYELNVTLGKLRAMQVFVVGEVESPGTYTISSLATVINALSLAGGPSRNGSLRKIQFLRNGKVVQEIDLYDMFLTGDRSKDVRLESGDTIFVPVIGPVAAVAGEVKRPGIYELKGTTSLSQVLHMAGGITAAGDTARIQVERIAGNTARVALDYEPKSGRLEENLAGVQIQDRDMIKVFPVYKALRNVVSLQGNAVRPGEYQYKSGMRVTDVLPSFELLLPDSFLESAEIIRLMKPDFHKETVTFNLGKALAGDEKENLLLQEQDTIRVFSRWDMEEKPTVSINGFVVNPGNYDYYPRMTVRDLVTAAGSLKRNAFLNSAELTRISVVDGKAKAIRGDVDLRKALAGDPQQNLVLQPDDVLIVRGIVEWLESTDRFVTLRGEVMFPGTYSITKGEKMSSVIRRAGGYTEKAYLNGVKFVRKSVQKDQQKRMDEIIQRSEQDILKKQGELASVAASREELEATKAALEGLQKTLEKLKTVRAEGRVVIRLARLEEFENSPYDLELHGGDNLEIPPTPAVVNVLGQVYNQTTLIYQPAGKVSYYLKKAGGPTKDADESEIYVIKADGSVVSRQQSSLGIRWDEDARSWTFGGFMSASLQPGDTLVVPQKLERTAWLRDIKDITQILANVALTAGTVLLGLK